MPSTEIPTVITLTVPIVSTNVNNAKAAGEVYISIIRHALDLTTALLVKSAQETTLRYVKPTPPVPPPILRSTRQECDHVHVTSDTE
jgi:hypothetical protein